MQVMFRPRAASPLRFVFRDCNAWNTAGTTLREWRSSLRAWGHAVVRKKAGRLANLVESVERNPMPPATAAIGHTRRATNGAPSDVNAHPHPPRTLVVAISQSGETMDTLMALRHEREQGSMVLSICNTQVASIPRESDAVRSSTRSRACRPRSNGCSTRRQARPDSAGR